MSNENGKLLDHEYDGIQELDNNLPTWWLWTFFVTIIFGFLYWIHYSFTGDGPSLDEELSRGMAQVEQMRERAENQGTEGLDEGALLADGKRLYNSYCAACHKADGGGMVGPNLTDKFWIHGTGDNKTITLVIKNGILDKGMPAWKEVLKPKDIKAVVAFVETLKGTNVSGGKAPQGNAVE